MRKDRLKEAIRAKQIPVPEDLWVRFLDDSQTHCGLCGNRGVIDTRESAVTPNGMACGGLFYCICPNGRIKEQDGKPLEV